MRFQLSRDRGGDGGRGGSLVSGVDWHPGLREDLTAGLLIGKCSSSAVRPRSCVESWKTINSCLHARGISVTREFLDGEVHVYEWEGGRCCARVRAIKIFVGYIEHAVDS